MPDTWTMTVPAALVVGVVALGVGWLVASRRLRTGRSRYAWLIFAPMFVFPGTFLWLAVTAAATQPILAFVFFVVGVGYGYLLVRMVRGVANATAAAATAQRT